jgi:hypothetical protein
MTWTLLGEPEKGPRYEFVPVIEGVLGYCESFVLFSLFGVFVHHRKRQLLNGEFIRMEE